MRKKWWLAIAALLVLVVLLAIGIPMFLPSTPGVTYRNYSRIENGMTREQVESLIGKPIVAQLFGKEDVWEGGNGDVIYVVYNKQGQVESTRWNGWTDRRSEFEKLRDRFPLIARDPPARLIISKW